MARQKSFMQSPVYWVLFALMFVVWAIFGLTAYHRGRMPAWLLVVTGVVFVVNPLGLIFFALMRRRLEVEKRQ